MPDVTDGGSSGFGCQSLLSCDNNCTTQACLNMCSTMASAMANALNKALNDCITNACTTGVDGGMGPCGTNPMSTQCSSCISNSESGRSPTGMTNGTCSPPNDPACGLCVDQLIACANNL
jgi:hypothetical protein